MFARILESGDFDPAEDIEAIAVNRCDPQWEKGKSPCEIGRKPHGRISIANSDAAAAAYTDQAVSHA